MTTNRGYINAICNGVQVKLYRRECGGAIEYAYRIGSHYYRDGRKVTKREILDRHDILGEKVIGEGFKEKFQTA